MLVCASPEREKKAQRHENKDETAQRSHQKNDSPPRIPQRGDGACGRGGRELEGDRAGGGSAGPIQGGERAHPAIGDSLVLQSNVRGRAGGERGEAGDEIGGTGG